MKGLLIVFIITTLLLFIPSADAGVGKIYKWSPSTETLSVGDTMSINITYEDPSSPIEFADQAFIQNDDELDANGKLKFGNTLCKALKAGTITCTEVSYQGRVSVTWSNQKNILILITNVGLSDKGYYGVALAQSNAKITGMEMNATKLNVQDGPHISCSPDSSYNILPGVEKSICCNASGDPTPQVTWSLDGGGITETGSGAAELTLNLTETDPCKKYSCHANNDVKTILVGNITVCPIIGPNAEPLSTLINCEVGQTCQVYCNATGDPTPNVTWSHNGVEIVTDIGGKAFLNMTLAKNDPCKIYTCHANNDAKTITVGNTKVCPLFGPKAEPLLTSVDCKVGKSCQVYCTATGNPTPNVTWSDNGAEIVTDSGKANLTLTLTENDLCKNYTCHATNGVKTITVGDTTVCPVFSPNVTLKPEDQDWNITENSSLSIECVATGRPEPSITLVKTSSGKTVQIKSNPYNIIEAGCGHIGEYKCTATNSEGSDTAAKTLTFLCGPTDVNFISGEDNTISVKPGGSVTLEFNSVAHPLPIYTLYHGDDEPLSNKTGRWTINNFNAANAGEYFCTAKNIVSGKVVNSSVITLILDVETIEAEYCCYKEIMMGLAVLLAVLLLLIIILIIMLHKTRRRLADQQGNITKSSYEHDVGHDKHLESNGSRFIEPIPMAQSKTFGYTNSEFKSDATDPVETNETAAAVPPTTTVSPEKGSQIITVKPPCLPPIETVSDKDKA